MADLESKILNTPSVLQQEAQELDGRDDREQEEQSEEEEDGEDFTTQKRTSIRNSATTMTRNTDIYAERKHGPESGPKAVISDKIYADKQAVIAQTKERLKVNTAAVQRQQSMVVGEGGGGGGGASISLSYTTQVAAKSRQHRERANPDSDDDAENEDTTTTTNDNEKLNDNDDDNDDDEFMQAYRKQRFLQLQQLARLPSFGSMVEITTQDAFLEAIDSVAQISPSTYVLCLLWEPYIQPCAPWRTAWFALASQYIHTKFISMRSECATAHWDPISLPALAIYKGGDTIGAVVRLHEKQKQQGKSRAKFSASSSGSGSSSSSKRLNNYSQKVEFEEGEGVEGEEEDDDNEEEEDSGIGAGNLGASPSVDAIAKYLQRKGWIG